MFRNQHVLSDHYGCDHQKNVKRFIAAAIILKYFLCASETAGRIPFVYLKTALCVNREANLAGFSPASGLQRLEQRTPVKPPENFRTFSGPSPTAQAGQVNPEEAAGTIKFGTLSPRTEEVRPKEL